jgi:plastocyanin
MINTLDSRALQRADCYGQRFMKAGDYKYNIVPAHGALISTDRPFVVSVRETDAESKMKQHDVQIKSESGKFQVFDQKIIVDVGDMVLWNCSDRDAHPYAVVGDYEFFNSNRLVNESGFSHAFGTAGDFHWVDAHGNGASGIVRVRDPKCKSDEDFKRWQQRLAKGTLVTISTEKVEPAEVEIVTGQTVFFIVTKCKGISITDARLLNQSADETGKDKAGAGPRQ